MKHLCIINPKAGQLNGRIDELVDEITGFFAGNPGLDYSIHITRWKRDASGYVMRYVRNASDMVRVYVFGGGGALFEVINGVVGLPNVQLAWYPLGTDNDLLTVFGKKSIGAFQSMKNLSRSPAIPIDTILAGNHYFVTHTYIGIEAVSYLLGTKLAETVLLPVNFCYIVAAFYYAFLKKIIRHYHIEIDNIVLDDDYIGMFIMNVPGNAVGTTAPEARLNDGYMDLYVIKQVPRNLINKIIKDYQRGLYKKWPQYISHHRCKKLKITSAADMTIAMDGEAFYNRELNMEIKPSSINFVCPAVIMNGEIP